MKNYKSIALFLIIIFLSCGEKEKKNRPDYSKKKKVIMEKVKETPVKKKTKTIKADLLNKGIGPVKSLILPEKIDQEMVVEGKELFKNKCSACHRVDRRFIGPNPTGILEKRSPEWIMNMTINPEEMIKKDPIAKELLKEYKGVLMLDQNTSEKEARAILEYFRTLK